MDNFLLKKSKGFNCPLVKRLCDVLEDMEILFYLYTEEKVSVDSQDKVNGEYYLYSVQQ